mmetsp:Transcript_19042/g.49540  ORF Transcript_19042/g.49540 Transcript_19042/m.49540 type:complete len:210 (-) Transcript_19042:62-691(-)
MSGSAFRGRRSKYTPVTLSCTSQLLPTVTGGSLHATDDCQLISVTHPDDPTWFADPAGASTGVPRVPGWHVNEMRVPQRPPKTCPPVAAGYHSCTVPPDGYCGSPASVPIFDVAPPRVTRHAEEPSQAVGKADVGTSSAHTLTKIDSPVAGSATSQLLNALAVCLSGDRSMRCPAVSCTVHWRGGGPLHARGVRHSKTCRHGSELDGPR